MKEQRSSAQAFLGKGWGFPVCPEAGGVSMSAYELDIAEAIRIILLTNRGERLMRPEFGASLVDFLFESMSSEAIERLRVRVRDALIDWEPRIDVESVVVAPAPGQPNVLLIEMKYRVRATNTHANLVFPFYLEEGSPQ